MKKSLIITLLAACGVCQTAQAQGYHLYKNGNKQTVLSSELDSLVFFKSLPAQEDPEAEATDPANPTRSKKATTKTAERNQQWLTALNFADSSEYGNATRYCIEATPDLVIKDGDTEIWNMKDYKFMLEEGAECPSTVNPSLWRNTLCNVQSGLFEVVKDKIYQVRGFDMANISFILTHDNRWIVFDCMQRAASAQKAIELFQKHKPGAQIVGLLISHSHADHFGGTGAISNADNLADASLPLHEQFASGKVPVIVPAGFMKYVISENAYCGAAMMRRTNYQYGDNISRGVTGRMAMGIGMGQAKGTLSACTPTYEIEKDTVMNIDGLTVHFMLTPGTEAPAEMNAYFEDYRALWMAENCTGTMHNIYTLRGAEVRDAEEWCNYILKADQRFGANTDVVFQSHNWPHWGTTTVREYLRNTAAVYKFIHDQTLYYINQGLTPTEISDTLQLPDRLGKVWYTRQYYGTLSHNIKAVYQKYLGWYDANPVNLNLLTPEKTAKKWVEYLGDPQRVLRMAREDFAKGEYQWVAQVTKELVYADPTNYEARYLCADALEQLGYQSESGTWRNCYLNGALELRSPTPARNAQFLPGIIAQLASGSVTQLIEYAALVTNSQKVKDNDLSINFNITGQPQCNVIRFNGVVLCYEDTSDANAEATVTGTMADLAKYMTSNANNLSISGDASKVQSLFGSMDPSVINFNIIEP